VFINRIDYSYKSYTCRFVTTHATWLEQIIWKLTMSKKTSLMGGCVTQMQDGNRS